MTNGSWLLKAAHFTTLICLSLLLQACFKCDPVAPDAAAAVPAGTGLNRATITVEASISSGTRFVLYTNDNWQEPHNQHVTPGQFVTYRFDVPATLTSLRLDPSEKTGAVAVIRKIKFRVEGAPSGRIITLADFPRWLMYHCKNSYDPKDGSVTITADGPEMYTMSTVNLNTMHPE